MRNIYALQSQIFAISPQRSHVTDDEHFYTQNRKTQKSNKFYRTMQLYKLILLSFKDEGWQN